MLTSLAKSISRLTARSLEGTNGQHYGLYRTPSLHLVRLRLLSRTASSQVEQKLEPIRHHYSNQQSWTIGISSRPPGIRSASNMSSSGSAAEHKGPRTMVNHFNFRLGRQLQWSHWYGCWCRYRSAKDNAGQERKCCGHYTC